MEDQRFVAAVEAIYAAAAAPARWPQALQSIADCFGDVGGLMIYERGDGSFGSITSPSLDVAKRDYDDGEWWRHDIRFSRAIERGYITRADALTDTTIATPDELATLPFYTDFLKRHDLTRFGGIGISPDPRIAVALSVLRSGARPPWSEEELDLLIRLGRHIEQALRLGIRLINAEASQMALADALTRVGVGVFLLDRAGRVLFANPAAEAFLGDGLSLADGVLSTGRAGQREELRAAIAQAAEGGDALALAPPPRPLLISGADGDNVLAVHLLPVRPQSDDGVERLLADVSAIAVITSSSPAEPADPALVRDLLGLTLSEARLASLVGSGLAPREASERLGITEETARTALKRVFQKSGLSRQSELAALLARMVVR